MSLILGVWALATAVTPFFPSALAPAAVGLALGSIALRTERAAAWRRAAAVGLGLNALAIATVVVVFLAT